MATYIVSYDLSGPDRNYSGLYEWLRTFPRWAKISESCWAVVSPSAPDLIRDQARQVLDQNDRVFIGVLKAPAAWYGLPDEVSTWLKENL